MAKVPRRTSLRVVSCSPLQLPPSSDEWCYSPLDPTSSPSPSTPRGLYIEPQPAHALEMTLDDALALERAVPILIHVRPVQEETVVPRLLRLGARAAPEREVSQLELGDVDSSGADTGSCGRLGMQWMGRTVLGLRGLKIGRAHV